MNDSETGYVMQPAPQVVLTPAAPAAGQLLDVAANGNYRSRIRAVVFQLVTSAFVGNRFPSIAIRDGDGNTLALEASAVAAPANSNHNVFGHAGRTNSAGVAGVFSLIPVPSLTIEPGWSIELGALGVFDGADLLRFVQLTIEQFPNVDVQVRARERAAP